MKRATCAPPPATWGNAWGNTLGESRRTKGGGIAGACGRWWGFTEVCRSGSNRATQDGKEGVAGSSPAEGFPRRPRSGGVSVLQDRIRIFALEAFGSVWGRCGVWRTFVPSPRTARVTASIGGPRFLSSARNRRKPRAYERHVGEGRILARCDSETDHHAPTRTAAAWKARPPCSTRTAPGLLNRSMPTASTHGRSRDRPRRRWGRFQRSWMLLGW